MPQSADHSALLEAFRTLLAPVTRLALARGLPYQALDELLRASLVMQARELHGNGNAHGMVSRISTATGLTRREVGRLIEVEQTPPEPRRWLAGEIFTRWMSDPVYAAAGHPAPLPRTGDTPSFESLARSVTNDVHPRSLLDELTRLGMAHHDPDRDVVTLTREAFVPRAKFSRMVGLLGENVGDHLAAAVTNVLGAGDEHFEQAVFADELSEESVRALRPLIAACWTDLFSRLAPALQSMIDDDAKSGRPADQRVRVGFYSYADRMNVPGPIPDARPVGDSLSALPGPAEGPGDLPD